MIRIRETSSEKYFLLLNEYLSELKIKQLKSSPYVNVSDFPMKMEHETAQEPLDERGGIKRKLN
jgi:hypothetical protein